jgi:mannose-6-phosphate isomerase-like protein (cupin superfamily)
VKSIKVTPEQMGRRMARFKDLKSYQYANEAAAGIPMAVLEKIAAHRVYPLMVPETYSGRSAQAPIKGAPGVVLHIHEQTIENFFCLSGRFEIGWGDPGEEHSVTLEPLDFISVPPGVPRRFTNVHATETGRLLVIIHVQTQEQSDRIAYQPELREEIEQKHGRKTVDALDRIGINFTAGV